MAATGAAAGVAETGDLLVASSFSGWTASSSIGAVRLARADRSDILSSGRTWNTSCRRPRIGSDQTPWIDSVSDGRLRERSLRASDHVGFLVASPTNVRYLTGFTGDSSVLLVGLDREILVSDGRFATQIDQECPGLEAHIRPTRPSIDQVLAHVGRVIEGLGWRASPSRRPVAPWPSSKCCSSRMPAVELTGVERVGRGAAAGQGRRARSPRSARPFGAPSGPSRCSGPACASGRDARKTSPMRWKGYLRRCGATAASFPADRRRRRPRGLAACPADHPDRESGDADFVLVDWGATGRALQK